MQTHRGYTQVIAGSVTASLLAASALAGDWPQWRGPNRNGMSDEGGWNPKALEGGAKVAWRASIGEGYASPVIAGGKVYATGNSNGQDRVYCFDAASGALLWNQGHPAEGGGDAYKGPRATPAVEGGKLFAMSREGAVVCLDAADGKVVWRKNLVADAGIANLNWGLAGSPLVVGDLLILNAGSSGLALKKDTGAVAWSTGTGVGGYASPVACTLDGKPGLLIFGAEALFGVTADSGKVLWSHPWKTSYNVNAPDPVPLGSKVFISSGYGSGSAVLDLAQTPPAVVWQNKLIASQFASSILREGYLYGCDGNAGKGRLRCVEFETGKEVWAEDTGFSSLILVDGKLLILHEAGKLTIAEATPKGFARLSEAQALDRKLCWTAPAFSGGRVYCRNQPGDLVCIDVR